ncbi:beta-galactosidase, partial [Candidatus Aerophobetes bacterium]|nr:beta-galactosidase [Candidatus Aerophobetes bacterium]
MNKRERLSMDFGWKFHLGHSRDISRDFEFGGGDPNFKTKAGDAVGAARPDFDDSKWRDIDLPHDWAVELDFDEGAERYHGYKPLGREWPATSIGWYRKTFKLAKSDEGKRLSIEFDGIFRDSIIWLNGH